MITPSQDPVPSEVAEDTPHLRQLPKEVVTSLCFESLRVGGSSFGVCTEVEAFKTSRTAWDATRLANALFAYDPLQPDVMAVVGQLDREAEAVAGMPLPNRHMQRT